MTSLLALLTGGLEVSEVNNRLKQLRRTADRLTATHGGAASDKQTDER